MYDEVGRKISQTDANGHTTRFAYDIVGRLVQKTLPLGQYATFTYNSDDTLATVTDFNGHITTCSYDAAGRKNAITHDDGTGITIVYNPDDSVQQTTRLLSSDSSVVKQFSYDATFGWLDSVQTTYGLGHSTVSYGYDAGGRRVSIQSASGTTQYTYDSDGRLSTVISPDLAMVTYAYDKVGNRTGLNLPGHVNTSYTYDRLNRLLSVSNSTGPSYSYVLDPAGKRISMTDSSMGTTSYGYDADGRLTSETFPNQTTNEYGYDAVGNRISSNGVTWTYDANDRLLSAGDVVYSYDNNGNVTGLGGTAYTYDAENHLIGAGAVGYVYDADGNRIQTNDNGSVTNYIVDGSMSYPSVLEERDADNNLVARYDYGADRIRMDRTGVGTSYYVYDGLGSVRALTNTAGAVTDTYTYDAFGNTSHQSGSSTNAYLFNGQARDRSGLYFLRARYYNPADGRFMSQDPLSGSPDDPASLHRYLYASADPVNRIDPGGQEDFSLAGTLVSSSLAATLGGMLDSVEWGIKDQFAAAAGVDSSNERLIAALLLRTGNRDAQGNIKDPSVEQNTQALEAAIQNLELALFVYHIGGALADAAEKLAGSSRPPFSGFAEAIQTNDNALFELANEDEAGGLSGRRESEAFNGEACSAFCMVAGTVIHMADGSTKPIEKVIPSDWVLSFNPITGEQECCRVSETFSRKSPVLVAVTLNSSDANTDKLILTCTPSHAFWVEGKNWVDASELRRGDEVKSATGKSLRVASVAWLRNEQEEFTTYNLSVDRDHAYYAGASAGGVLVHNDPNCMEGIIPGGDPNYFLSYEFSADGTFTHLISAGTESPASGLSLFKKAVDQVGGIDKIQRFSDSYVDRNLKIINELTAPVDQGGKGLKIEDAMWKTSLGTYVRRLRYNFTTWAIDPKGVPGAYTSVHADLTR